MAKRSKKRKGKRSWRKRENPWHVQHGAGNQKKKTCGLFVIICLSD
jgi:hypothetical protein